MKDQYYKVLPKNFLLPALEYILGKKVTDRRKERRAENEKSNSGMKTGWKGATRIKEANNGDKTRICCALLISVMWKMWTELWNPGIKTEFTV